jgi:hypothetical protein
MPIDPGAVPADGRRGVSLLGDGATGRKRKDRQTVASIIDSAISR